MQLDIESLRAFVTVLQLGGMTAAADALGMSQSAVSWKIKRLEERVGRALLVRDEGSLRRAHATFADYMPTMQHDPDFVDFCDISAELSRDFRGLRIWLPVKLFGLDAFREALDEKLDLARWATDQIREIPELEIVTEPRLSLLSFRVRGDHEDEATRALLHAINARQNVYLTGTMVDGRFVARICVLSFRTHMDRMEMCVQDIRAALAEVLAKG